MDGFCSELYSLNKINVIQKNNVNIKYVDNKILVGKSDVKKDVFDIILFGNRDINHIKIDSNIKRLCSFAFEHCSKLNKVDIDDDSQLKFIDENALSCTLISNFFVPLNVIQIKENALSNCNKLIIIEVANPNLLKIDKESDLNNLSKKTIIMIAVK